MGLHWECNFASNLSAGHPKQLCLALWSQLGVLLLWGFIFDGRFWAAQRFTDATRMPTIDVWNVSRVIQYTTLTPEPQHFPSIEKYYKNRGTGIGPNISKEGGLLRLLRFWF